MLAMMKGDMPRASIEPTTFQSMRIYRVSSLSDAFFDDKNPTIQAALQACEIMVASAAPFTPMPKVKMNNGSRPMLSTAPISTEYMAMAGRPCVLMNVLSPTDVSTNMVPARYIDR